jgi:hypothetical protein
MSFWDSSGIDFSTIDQGSAPGDSGGDMGDLERELTEKYQRDAPFAYSKGSLLTPWEGKFDGSQYGGGGSGVAAFKPFNYADISYQAARPGGFEERYNDPGNFTYGEYQGGPAFQAPTEQDLQADPGYQFRLQQGQKALEASKAAQGVLRTGGTAKALTKYGQELGAQEYGAAYGRKRSEYDLEQERGRYSYGTNRANVAENFDRNVRNQQTGYGLRQGAWRDNAAVALEGSRHGYDVATGVYDRNYAKARQGYQDERANAQARASAGAARANQNYNRALNEYQMGRDEFWTNQDRQYNILDREATRGWDAARTFGTTQAELALGRGNAQASGTVGSANAYQGALGNIGNNAMELGLYAYGRGDDAYGRRDGRYRDPHRSVPGGGGVPFDPRDPRGRNMARPYD